MRSSPKPESPGRLEKKKEEKKRDVSLPPLDPMVHRVEGGIIVEPMTCPQVGGPEVSNNVMVGDVRQFLLQRGLCRFQGDRMLRCWSLATEDVRSGHSPSACCRGA